MQPNLLTYIHTHRALAFTLRALVTLAALAWVFARLDLAQFARAALTPDAKLLALMIVTALAIPLLGGAKVWALLTAFARVPLPKTIAYFWVATAIGAFTPAALGDFSIAAFLRRENVPLHHGLSVMLVDRVLSVLLYALVFTPLTLFFLLDTSVLWWLPVIALAAAVGALVLNHSARARRFIRARLIQGYAPIVEDFARAVSDLLRLHPFHLAANVALGVARALVSGVVVFFAIAAAGAPPPLIPVICASNALTLVNLLPISLGGAGVYEAGGVGLFGQMGMDSAQVFAGLVYQRAYIFASSLLILALASLVSRARRETPR